MRILYIADLNSILVRRLLKELAVADPGNDYLLLDIFRGMLVTPSELQKLPILKMVGKLWRRRMLILAGALRSVIRLIFMPQADIIHIHYLNPLYRPFLGLFRLKSAQIITTLFGSDFYLHTRHHHQSIRPFFSHSSLITFSTLQMSLDFSARYPEYAGKIRICPFGLGMLDEIDELAGHKEIARAEFALPDNRIILCCGHSANRRELHSQIISQLNLLSKEVKEQIFAVFPMTYNVVPELLSEVTNTMEQTGIPYLVLTDHLADGQIASLRVATDIMINVPSSDQLNASMLETLYAGGIVITGKWLPYELLDANNIACYRIADHNELAPVLEALVTSIENGKIPYQSGQNHRIIGNLFNWGSTVKGWMHLYQG
jgi:hypothetical protein